MVGLSGYSIGIQIPDHLASDLFSSSVFRSPLLRSSVKKFITLKTIGMGGGVKIEKEVWQS